MTIGRSAAIVVGLPFRPGDQSIALSKFASSLASASDCFTLFASLPFRRLFVSPFRFHFSKEAFTLHLLFQYSKRLVDVVVAHEDLQDCSDLLIERPPLGKAASFTRE